MWSGYRALVPGSTGHGSPDGVDRPRHAARGPPGGPDGRDCSADGAMIGKISTPRGTRLGAADLLPVRAAEGARSTPTRTWWPGGGTRPSSSRRCARTGGRDFRHADRAAAPAARRDGRPRAMARPVWHCSVRAAPGDRTLSDEEWAQIAARRDAPHRAVPRGQEDEAVRWVAVRHADDHIHLVAMLARQDGRRGPLARLYRVARGLPGRRGRATGCAPPPPCDRTAARRPGRAETGESRPQAVGRGAAGHPAPARRHRGGRRGQRTGVLRAAGAWPGVRVRCATAAAIPGRSPGTRSGWTATPAGTAQPVWYGGGKLAADLSLPKLWARWQPAAPAPARGPARRAGRDLGARRPHRGAAAAAIGDSDRIPTRPRRRHRLGRRRRAADRRGRAGQPGAAPGRGRL